MRARVYPVADTAQPGGSRREAQSTIADQRMTGDEVVAN